LDFATLGNLKLVEHPAVYTITPYGFQSITSIFFDAEVLVKVSLTETGVIFSSILWEDPGMSEACVILNEIDINIMDYIKPAYCNEAQVHVTHPCQTFYMCDNLSIEKTEAGMITGHCPHLQKSPRYRVIFR
jgi:vesicle coat complex subunit